MTGKPANPRNNLFVPGRTLPETNPPYDQCVAAAMLLGVTPPLRCSGCIGSGRRRAMLAGVRRCLQCQGSGFDYVHPDMAQWMADNKLPRR